MAKVTLNPLAPPDSPIYSQPVSIGTRFTKSLPKPLLDSIDLQNLPFDPAVEAGEASLRATKLGGKE
jgi:hypothetical protein